MPGKSSSLPASGRESNPPAIWLLADRKPVAPERPRASRQRRHFAPDGNPRAACEAPGNTAVGYEIKASPCGAPVEDGVRRRPSHRVPAKIPRALPIHSPGLASCTQIRGQRKRLGLLSANLGGLGRLGRDHGGTPGRRSPPFPGDGWRGRSQDRHVVVADGRDRHGLGRTTLVESRRPPKPTSTTATSTPACAGSAGRRRRCPTSNSVGSDPARRGRRAAAAPPPRRSAAAPHRGWAARPPGFVRGKGSGAERCKPRPGNPRREGWLAVMAATEPLPLVPPMCTAGKAASGWPRRPRIAWILSSPASCQSG